MGWSTQQSAARIIEELADEYGGMPAGEED